MTFVRQCGPCGGHGYYYSDPKDTCKVCEGMGEVTLPGSANHYKQCRPCNGHGFYYTNPKDTCGSCKGLGVIMLPAGVLGSSPGSIENKPTTATGRGTVFLVHGQNTSVRDAIDLYLTKELGLRVKIMAAEAHGGRTLPEKFEEIAQECSFAVFLMTGDDHLFTDKRGIHIIRARQNVVLEIGYFWGAIGRRKHVAFLVDQGLDLPSDIQGVGWIPITVDLSETKLRLRKELEDAGLVQRTAAAR